MSDELRDRGSEPGRPRPREWFVVSGEWLVVVPRLFKRSENGVV